MAASESREPSRVLLRSGTAAVLAVLVPPSSSESPSLPNAGSERAGLLSEGDAGSRGVGGSDEGDGGVEGGGECGGGGGAAAAPAPASTSSAETVAARSRGSSGPPPDHRPSRAGA